MENNCRLIDANVVYEMGHRTPFHIGIADLCDLKELLADVPTVDAVEVVHGRWNSRPHYKFNSKGVLIKYCDFHHCSVCKKDPPMGMRTNYCPSCGAKMDGGNDDG